MPGDDLSLPVDNVEPGVADLLADLRGLIHTARERAAIAVNRELTMMRWHIGDRIRTDIFREERAAYGERIVQSLSRQLTAEFGRGFGRTNLLYMMQFAETFPDLQIVQSLIGQLGWTHILLLLPIKDRLKREFYAEMCRLEKWSVRKGQMERYLRWLNRYERRKHDEAPVGLILCSERSPQQIELLELDTDDIRVAEYFTKKLPPALLEEELRKAIRRAREQLAQHRTVGAGGRPGWRQQ